VTFKAVKGKTYSLVGNK